MFVITPDREYIKYIDVRTLAILFCLMGVMAGLKEIDVFECLAQKMLKRVGTERMLVFIPVMLCFFLSMFITNDVALITFVPFTFIVLNMADRRDLTVPVVAMETTAANLGSMMTPLGNPQNIYLFSISGMSIAEFIKLVFPYGALSFVLFVLWGVFRREKGDGRLSLSFESSIHIKDKKLLVIYLCMFVLCLLTVVRLIHYGAALGIVLGLILVFDRGTLKKIDYSLLLTFIGFFVFIGNMGRVEAFSEFIERIILNNEVVTSVVSSQVISNVPAALLLSGFTDKTDALIVGTNIGGLGTLIASMASLISFKFIGKRENGIKGKYIGYFSVVNIIFLVALMGLYCVIK